MMARLARRALTGFIAIAAAAPMLLAQGRDPLARLDSASHRIVAALVDSARTEGLPSEPIISQAQLGVARHASSTVISSVVRKVFLALREARASLGEHATSEELSAGAQALEVGIPTSALIDLRQARHGKSVTVPLVVLADLVTRGVPRDTASRAILQLWMGGAGDADLLGLPVAVEQDIVSGAAPGDALLNRIRTIPLRPPPGKVPE